MGPDPDSVKSKRYNSTMDMLIPHFEHEETQSGVLHHCGKAFPFPDTNSHRPSPTQEVQPEFSRFCQADQQPDKSGKKAKEPATPSPSLASRTVTPSPALQCGPGDSPSTHSNTSTSTSGTPEGTSQGWQEVAGRFLGLILRKLCFRLSKKWHGKWKRVETIYIVEGQSRATTEDSRKVKLSSLYFKC